MADDSLPRQGRPAARGVLNWPVIAALYAWTVSVGAASFLLWRARRAAGLDAEIGQILLWQALVYGLWFPIAALLALVLRRLGLGARGLAVAFVLALPAVAFHSAAAGALDAAFSPRMARLGALGAAAERMPVDLLFYMAIAAALFASSAHREARALAAALDAARKAPAPASAAEEPLLVSAGSRRIPVPVAAVEWLGAAGNYVVVHWDGREGLVRSSLQEIEQGLDPARFARVHRSTIANLAMVASASSLADGSWRLTMESGAELVASRTYRDRILERLGRR